jgi:hypothetical protein
MGRDVSGYQSRYPDRYLTPTWNSRERCGPLHCFADVTQIVHRAIVQRGRSFGRSLG